MNKITILGSGTSTGVPILGCKCKVCQSNDPRNQRLRTSAVITLASGKNILIDASPDLRTQLLRSQIDRIESVIITHDHADHTHGMDDLRPFPFIQGTPLEVFASEDTSATLREKFPYIFQRHKVFENKPVLGGGVPLLELVTVSETEQLICNERFTFASLPHGHIESLAVRHRGMAYLVDCRELPPALLSSLRNARLELLIIDCLRYEPHSTHLHLDQTLSYIKEIDPKLAVLTHLGHEMDYLELTHQIEQRSIKNVIPAVDGLSFYYS